MMRIEYGNNVYKLEFQRIQEFTNEEIPRKHLSDPVRFKPKGTVTEARLMVWTTEGILGWEPVKKGRARSWVSRSGKTADPFSREVGRRAALTNMFPAPKENEVPDPLRAVVLQAYYNRPHDPDPQSLRRQIARLEEELERLESRPRWTPPTGEDHVAD